MTNKEIREAVKNSRFPMWMVADKCGYSGSHWSVKLRKEFSDEMKAKVYQAIEELKREG